MLGWARFPDPSRSSGRRGVRSPSRKCDWIIGCVASRPPGRRPRGSIKEGRCRRRNTTVNPSRDRSAGPYDRASGAGNAGLSRDRVRPAGAIAVSVRSSFHIGSRAATSSRAGLRKDGMAWEPEPVGQLAPGWDQPQTVDRPAAIVEGAPRSRLACDPSPHRRELSPGGHPPGPGGSLTASAPRLLPPNSQPTRRRIGAGRRS